MLTADIQKLEPGSVIRLFDLDLTELGGDVQRFHGHMTEGPIIWQGERYLPISIDVGGLELATNRTVAPSLTVGNIVEGVQGALSSLCLFFDDFVGARLTIRETLSKYLDAANFPDGNSQASDEELVSVWFVEQKSSENAQQITFELSSPADFQDQQIPNRQITSRCTWAVRGEYRGEACGYTGPYMDIEGNPTGNPALDKCSGLMGNGCKARFGKHVELPFGGFPSAGLIK